MKIIHFLHCPWTGLGLYGGFRGNRWLKNRIKVFKQFVIPSLKVQTNKNFVLWCAWRHEEKNNPYVLELIEWLNGVKEFKSVHTFNGICFYDDKYKQEEAINRLLNSIHRSIGELLDTISEVDYVYMTIQPSDDIYRCDAVDIIQEELSNSELQAFGFKKGYIMNYRTKELADYNPTTNPPFYTIKFPRDIFINPLAHAQYTALKADSGQYRAGTPLPSHEYVKDCLKYKSVDERGFLVGTHGENISTIFTHPFKGRELTGGEKENVLAMFGIDKVEPLDIKISFRKWLLRKLPHKVQRKLRYWFGELLYNKIYEFLRN